MCGIAGLVSPDLSPEARLAAVRVMCDTLSHRGPDDEGYFTGRDVTLGMRRLSIIDLPGGHQPIANEDGSRHIVFNGEIYNFGELRRDLIARGHSFSTSSDTEVILHQHEQDGAACVNRLNGMFAFAIWNAADGELTVARDRLGVKPLYYFWNGRTLLFASEIKALMATGLVERRLDREALWHYLTFRYVPQPCTIWEGVRTLLPGHTLRLRNGGTPEIRRYWDLPFDATPRAIPPEEALAEFSELFVDAVRIRLVADVPVGILLSGGLDSSAVAAAAAESGAGPLHSFSVAFEDPAAFDETPYARAVAQAVGLQHHEIRVGHRDFLDFLPAFVRLTDEPLADLASVPLYFVSKLARAHVKVVLSGEGSDEVLAGYDFDRVMGAWDGAAARARWPAPLKVAAGFSAGVFGPGVAARVRRGFADPHEALTRWPVSMTDDFSSQDKRAMLLADAPFADSLDLVTRDLNRFPAAAPLNRVLYSYCQSWLVEDLLMKADKMTMANSLELRVPFLDYRLVEWAARAPIDAKVARQTRGYRTKDVLRRFAAARLPASIIERPKQGFPVPVYEWLAGPLKRWATELLEHGELRRFIRPEALRTVTVAGTAAGDRRAQHRLWNLLVLELWMREWQPA